MASITQDLRFKQATLYSRAYNLTPMRLLGRKSTNRYLADYFNSKSVTDV